MSPDPSFITISIRRDLHQEALSLAGKLQAQRGQRVSLQEALRFAVQAANRELEADLPNMLKAVIPLLVLARHEAQKNNDTEAFQHYAQAVDLASAANDTLNKEAS